MSLAGNFWSNSDVFRGALQSFVPRVVSARLEHHFSRQMNMTTSAVPSGTTSAPMNVFARFIGILTAPRATYQNVVAHPKWLGMYILTATLIAFGAALPMTSDAGKQAAVDQQVSTMEGLGMEVSDEAYAAMQKGTAIMPYTTAVSVLVFMVLAYLIMSGILFAIFNAALGGEARFKQVLTVLVHSSVIGAVGAAFAGPLNYVRGSVQSPATLGALLPMLDEKSFIGKLAGMVDLFTIWGTIVLAIGLAVLYRRKTQPIAMAFLALYAVIAICVAYFTSN